VALVLALVGPELGHPGAALASDGQWFGLATPDHYRTDAAATFDSRRGRALTFGGTFVFQGRGGVTFLSDIDSTWAFALDAGLSFASLPFAGPAPSARALTAMAYDSTADRAWLFGGRGLLPDFSGGFPTYSPIPHGDLWSLDLSAALPHWQAVAAIGPAPAPRYGHSLVADVAGRRLLLFGGRDSSAQVFSDAWSLDLSQAPPVWSPIVVSGPAPLARWHHACAFDPAGQRMFVMSGQNGGSFPDGVWALDLSGTPRWDSLSVTGTPPPRVSGAAWDRRRARVVAYSPTTGVFALDPTNGAWSALEVAALPGQAPLLGGQSVQVALDAERDLLYLPFSQVVGQFFFGDVSRHHVITFPAAEPPAALSPSLLHSSPWQGVYRSTWQLGRTPGLFYQLPVLQRPAYGSPWFTFNGPVAYDAAADTAVYLDENPSHETVFSWRLTWSDPFAAHESAPVSVDPPPAPIDMAASVDTAMIAGGTARLQWTLGDDSLSYIVRPAISRWTANTGWIALAPIWPDTLRRVQFVDGAIVTGEDYRYRVDWPCDPATCATGEVALTSGAPIPLFAERSQPGLGTYMRWTVPGSAPFTARVDRRLSAALAWAAYDTISADAARDLIAAERALPLGTHVEYRLAWDDAGLEAHSAAVVFDVPPFDAQVSATVGGTRVATLTWQLWPVDSLLSLRVRRIQQPLGPTLVLAGPLPADEAAFTYSDTTVSPSTTYAYELVADDGTQQVTSGATSVTTADPPHYTALTRSSLFATLSWAPTAAATGYEVWRRLDGGAWQSRAALAPQASEMSFSEPVPAGTILLGYQLRWREADARVWALPDTALSGTTPPPPGVVGFASVSGNPATDGLTLLFQLPDSRPARVRVHGLDGRVRLSHTLEGPGTVSWRVPGGVLAPGLYWVRFEHPALEKTVRVAVLH
jgi:hypothetical protein